MKNCRFGKSTKFYFSVFLGILLFLLQANFLYAKDFYWENEKQISQLNSVLPASSSVKFTDENGNENQLSVLVWQEVLEKRNAKQIYLSAKIYFENSQGSEWYDNEKFAGPFAFSGEIPNIFSVSVNKSGVISVAALESANSVSVFTSTDYGKTFSKSEIYSQNSVVAPRIFALSDGRFIIFTSTSLKKGDVSSFSILNSVSKDGKTWSNFTNFNPAEKTSNPFVPFLFNDGAQDFVVFQASHTSANAENVNKSRRSYQLYSTISQDGGRTWTSPVLITDDSLKSMIASENKPFDNYHNQKPNIFQFNGKKYISWERTYYTSENAQIYVAEFSDEGKILSPIERISSGDGNASGAQLFSFEDTLSIVWSDTRNGINKVYLAQKQGLMWQETLLSNSKNENTFANAIISNYGKDLNIFWQSEARKSKSKIIQLSPDRNVEKPKISPISFKEGKKSTAEKVTAKIILPSDSSGIEGFAYIWTQDENEEVPEYFMNLPRENSLSNYATEDGKWFLKVKALDYAGNWSKESVICYERDTTPPSAPIIDEIETDAKGFAKSNSITFTWKSEDEGDVAGYSWNLERIANEKADFEKTIERAKISKVPNKLMTREKSVSFKNYDNGIYAFSVSAIDECGNISKSTTTFIKLNKYIPYTTISAVNYSSDEFGVVNLTIVGKGFFDNGKISEIYIDKDGKAPYDKVLKLENNDYTLASNRRITNIQLEDLEEGTYKIGLRHTKRGVYFGSKSIKISETGTVKVGEFSYEYVPSWENAENKKFHFEISQIILSLIFILALAGFALSVYGLIKSAKESNLLKQEINALLTGEIMPLKKNEKAKNLQKIGFSLKYKLLTVTSSLIIMIIILVSIPLGYIMIQNQEKTLAESLENQTKVLLDSLATGTKTYLPSQNILELGFLPSQASALKEANYVTIVGLNTEMSNTNIDYLWATNDANINQKIDTKERIYGRSRLTIEQMEEIEKVCEELNQEAVKEAGSISKEIASLTREGVALALKTDSTSVARRTEIGNVTRALNEKLNTTLSQISNAGTNSIPYFDNSALDKSHTTYLFYKPVLYRQGSEETFVRGIILLEISTTDLITSVEEARNKIIILTVIIAALAIVAGIIITMIFSNIIVSPLKKLTRHVKMIRDTGNKAELEGKDIKIKSNDEIGLLGDNINDMTHQLVEAAVYENMLLGGKEVQRAFLPLDMIDPVSKTKLSVGHMENDNVSFFGYYEGAKGVSGDYFDFRDLDGRYFALIKCDVSGKGSPAALIMAEVAALFCDYFKTWSIKKNGTDLSPLVSKINDHIESRALRGKFAAFTLALFDTKMGDLYFCNAGDNIIHIYDASERKKKTITLTETPPAGPFPSFMVEMKGGYPVEKIHLDKDDVIFLYTDGIEEAKRLYRDTVTGEALRFKPDTTELVTDEEDKDATDGEEMSPERVNAIIEAVFDKGTYTLVKKANPIDDITDLHFDFDFSNCTGKPEEVIMALVSIEKVFRLYKDTNTTPYDHAVIDKKVDAFMKEHFVQYDTYCSEHAEHPTPELQNEYMLYTNVKEDEQFDDLTLVAIKKK